MHVKNVAKVLRNETTLNKLIFEACSNRYRKLSKVSPAEDWR